MTEVSSTQAALQSSSSSDVPHQYKSSHIAQSQSLPELRAKHKKKKKLGNKPGTEMHPKSHSKALAKPLKSVGDSITILGCFLALSKF